MVSFSCENCGDVLTKGKLDKHVMRCRGASFTCIDCMVHFPGNSYKGHTSCMTEAQKYEGAYRKEKDKNKNKQQDKNMIPRKAYVEDEGDTEMKDATAHAEVPPRAPSPPPPSNEGLPPGVNVYDFLVKEERPSRSDAASRLSGITDDSHYARHGFTYGSTPLQPSMDRNQSFSSLVPHTGDSQTLDDPAHTPAHRTSHGATSSDKKRKRGEHLDTSQSRSSQQHDALTPAAGSARPSLHSGLTGGLNRLLSRPVDEFERQAGLQQSPPSPVKRSKRERSDTTTAQNGDSPATYKAIEYKKAAAPPGKAAGQSNSQELVRYGNPAEHFLSFITKGTESERGQSLNKILKRYHRDRRAGSVDNSKAEDDDKDLWKELRVRRNENGEIVLFM